MASVLLLAGWARAGTIVYSYDEQHRLAGANYNNQATVTYDYDKADNLIGYTVLTDSQYFRPFMLYFSKAVKGPEYFSSEGGSASGGKPFLLYFTLLDDQLQPRCYREEYVLSRLGILKS
jgi:YD repeat-containing protein